MTLITEKTLREALLPEYGTLPLYIYDSVSSTNDLAKELVSQSEHESDSQTFSQGAHSLNTFGAGVVMAHSQTQGRGRLGRSFFSPESGIYMSIIIKPAFDTSLIPLVTPAAAVAAAESIEKVCNKKADIKWVNDIYIDEKKVCGILTEGVSNASGGIEYIIVGIGINTSCDGFPAELAETAGAVSGEYDKAELAAEIISSVFDYMNSLADRSFMPSYRQRSILTGKTVNVYKGAYKTNPEDELPSRPAKVLGIDDDGGLMVIYTDGSRETLTTGEVTIRL